MRENAKARAVRFLIERRVMVLRAGASLVVAVVRGDSGELRTVTWDPGRGFRCDCPAIGLCAHGHAVASVVVVPPELPMRAWGVRRGAAVHGEAGDPRTVRLAGGHARV